jgi:hypothetical protein
VTTYSLAIDSPKMSHKNVFCLAPGFIYFVYIKYFWPKLFYFVITLFRFLFWNTVHVGQATRLMLYVSCLTYSSTLMIKVICSSETSINFHGTVRRYIWVQQFFYCCVCIRSHGEVSAEPLPSKDRGIDIETHRLMGKIYEVRRWDGLRYHDIRTKFHKDRFRHSENNRGTYRDTDSMAIW